MSCVAIKWDVFSRFCPRLDWWTPSLFNDTQRLAHPKLIAIYLRKSAELGMEQIQTEKFISSVKIIFWLKQLLPSKELWPKTNIRTVQGARKPPGCIPPRTKDSFEYYLILCTGQNRTELLLSYSRNVPLFIQGISYFYDRWSWQYQSNE